MATIICLAGLYRDVRQQSSTDLKILYFAAFVLSYASHWTAANRIMYVPSYFLWVFSLLFKDIIL